MNLTITEFQSGYNKLLKAFAQAQMEQRDRRVWQLRADGEQDLKARLLWLLSWALSTWDTTPGAYNHLTDTQVELILQYADCCPDSIPTVNNLKLT